MSEGTGTRLRKRSSANTLLAFKLHYMTCNMVTSCVCLHACTLMRMFVPTRMRENVPTHMQECTHTHPHARMYPPTCKNVTTPTHMQECNHTHPLARKQPHPPTYKDATTRTHMQAGRLLCLAISMCASARRDSTAAHTGRALTSPLIAFPNPSTGCSC